MRETIPATVQDKLLDTKPAINLPDFEVLYDQYAPALLGIVEIHILNKQQSTEALQMVFQEIWNKADEFDSQKMRLFTWLYQLTCNTVSAYNKASAATIIKTAVNQYKVLPVNMPGNNLTGYAG